MTQVPPFWQGFSAKQTLANTHMEQFCAGLYPVEQVRLQTRQVQDKDIDFLWVTFARIISNLKYDTLNKRSSDHKLIS